MHPLKRLASAARVLLLAAALAPPAAGQELPPDYLQLHAACGVRSALSNGELGLQELAAMAAERGLDVIVLGDRHRIGWEYGLPPALPLVRLRREETSVYTHGAARWLAEVRRVNAAQDRVLFIPGVTLRTHYWWSGGPLRRDLTLHETPLDLQLIGLDRPADYRSLPVIDGSFSTRYAARFLPATLVSLGVLLTGLFMLCSRRRLLLAGAGFLVVGLAGLVGHHPFRGSPFGAYRGPAGLAPFQEVIDYARERGAVVSWAAPDVDRTGRKAGGLSVESPPPPSQALLEARGYTAFGVLGPEAARWDGRREALGPGGAWDRMLEEYCRGERLEPAWALGSIDFRRDGAGPWLRLDGVQAVLLTRSRTADAVLEALRLGRMYAVLQGGGPPIRLDYFQVRSADGRVAEQGGELVAADRLDIGFRVSLADGGRERLKVQFIRSGRLLQEAWIETPAEERFVDALPPGSGKFFYRLTFKSARHEIITNPIFVTF